MAEVPEHHEKPIRQGSPTGEDAGGDDINWDQLEKESDEDPPMTTQEQVESDQRYTRNL